jgi:predicted transposase/invertase (TIGR01784 family)
MEARYINPFTDFGFKRLFGEEDSKPQLADFLNCLLPAPHKVRRLQYRNVERQGVDEAARKAIFDLYCETESGEHILVELQKAKQIHFKERMLYYATFPVQEQSIRGEWDFDLKAVYAVGLLDFIFDEKNAEKACVYLVQLKDQFGQAFTDKLWFIPVQLPRFDKRLDELETRLDKWLYFLKHLPELDKLPAEFVGDRVFEEASHTAELAALSPLQRSIYHQSLKQHWDTKNSLDAAEAYAREEGMAAGLAEGMAAGIAAGMAAGRAEGLAFYARSLLRRLERRFGVLSPELVIGLESLSEAQLEALDEQFDGMATSESLRVWLSSL